MTAIAPKDSAEKISTTTLTGVVPSPISECEGDYGNEGVLETATAGGQAATIYSRRTPASPAADCVITSDSNSGVGAAGPIGGAYSLNPNVGFVNPGFYFDQANRVIAKLASGRSAPVHFQDGVVQAGGPDLFQDYWLDGAGNVHGDEDKPPTGTHVELAGCGQSSASAVMARFGHFTTEEAADQHIRLPINLGGSLDAICDYYKMRGLEAKSVDGGNWQDIENALKKGFAVIISMSTVDDDHTIAVTGLYRDLSGHEFVQCHDTDGYTVLIARADFEQQWSGIKLSGMHGLPTGISCHYTVVGQPGSDLPGGGTLLRKIEAQPALLVLDAFDNISIGVVGYMGKEGVIGAGLVRTTAGLVEAASQAGPALVQIAGDALAWVCGEGISAITGTVTNPKANIFARVGLALVYGVLWVSQGVGSAIELVSQLLGGFVAFFTHLLTNPLNRWADSLHAAQDAINTVRQADSDGTTRQKHYWSLLCQTPAVPGKLYLLENLLSSGSSERGQMIQRVLDSCVDAKGQPDREQQHALVCAMGADKLSGYQLFTTNEKKVA